MIHEEKCYCATCDNCGESFTTFHMGYNLFVDRPAILDALNEEEWFTGSDTEHKGKHYCPNCFKEHPEDEDKIIVDMSRTKATEGKQEGGGHE